jgi:hypothetical protein
LQLTIQPQQTRKIQNMTTLHSRKSIDPSPLRWGLRFGALALALACFGLSPTAQALLPPPPPDGGYRNNNTAEGDFALFNLMTGSNNTATGFEALFMNTTGSWNTANGSRALRENNGNANTATGNNALRDNKTGTENTATGAGALRMNITGSDNTAVGGRALLNNTGGAQNTATGVNALFSNTSTKIGTDVISGDNNTANGWQALFKNTVGSENTAVGAEALYNNLGDLTGTHSNLGRQNSAFGSRALFKNEFGSQNTAIGVGALFNLQGLTIGEDGDRNSALGNGALSNNTHGSGNVAVGDRALGGATLATGQRTDPEDNTAVGAGALSSNINGVAHTAIGIGALASLESGENNIALGQGAGSGLTMGSSSNIDIGHPGVAEEHFTIRIGVESGNPMRTFIAGIHGVTTQESPAIPVVIDSEGQLGTESSSARFKKEIKPMNKASEAILAFKPVTFYYRSDKRNTPQFGLIAEEVAQVNPDLVVRDKNGEIYTVRYDAVNAMLLNEFLKAHSKMEEQEATIAQLKKDFRATVAELDARLKEQDSKIEKVSAQLEASKPAPQVVEKSR